MLCRNLVLARGVCGYPGVGYGLGHHTAVFLGDVGHQHGRKPPCPVRHLGDPQRTKAAVVHNQIALGINKLFQRHLKGLNNTRQEFGRSQGHGIARIVDMV